MAQSAQLQERINAFPTACRGAGLKVTPQRVAVYSMLVKTTQHPSPEEVYSEIRKLSPSISLATVYKILDMFMLKGFIRRVSTQDQVSRYDANLAPHDHLICSGCGKIQDIMGDEPQMRQPSGNQTNGFQVVSSEIHYHGFCGDCASVN